MFCDKRTVKVAYNRHSLDFKVNFDHLVSKMTSKPIPFDSMVSIIYHAEVILFQSFEY